MEEVSYDLKLAGYYAYVTPHKTGKWWHDTLNRGVFRALQRNILLVFLMTTKSDWTSYVSEEWDSPCADAARDWDLLIGADDDEKGKIIVFLNNPNILSVLRQYN